MKLTERILISILDIERLNKARLIKESKDKLQACFTDEYGRIWRTFRSADDVPLSRLAAIHTHLQYMAAGVSGKQQADALDAIDSAFAMGSFAVAGAVVHELRELPKKTANIYALTNIVAAHYVREDEEPLEFNDAVHQEKCDWILHQIETGGFFLAEPSLNLWLSPFKISGLHLKNNWHVFHQAAKKLKSLMDTVRSMREQSVSKQTDGD